MKNILGSIICLFLAAGGYAQPQFELSRNIYRIPYGNGISVFVSNDHNTHDPVGRYDLRGQGNGASCTANYPIVAAAEGIIRHIVDSNDVHGPTCTTNCAASNNYVWIEHANGEWTKYTHMVKNSVTASAGLQVGDVVCPGTLIGYECEIGQASGPHLHFEVRHPNNPLNVLIAPLGGQMDTTNNPHRIPVFHSVSKHYFEENDVWTASGSTACTSTSINPFIPSVIPNGGIRVYMATNTITIQSPGTITFTNGANGLFHAGQSITLSPGFTASAGSYFQARIGSCATTGMPGTCQ